MISFAKRFNCFQIVDFSVPPAFWREKKPYCQRVRISGRFIPGDAVNDIRGCQQVDSEVKRYNAVVHVVGFAGVEWNKLVYAYAPLEV